MFSVDDNLMAREFNCLWGASLSRAHVSTRILENYQKGSSYEIENIGVGYRHLAGIGLLVSVIALLPAAPFAAEYRLQDFLIFVSDQIILKGYNIIGIS